VPRRERSTLGRYTRDGAAPPAFGG
jgi:hypothetical protein